MRGTQGALIVDSALQILVGFSGLRRNVARVWSSHIKVFSIAPWWCNEYATSNFSASANVQVHQQKELKPGSSLKSQDGEIEEIDFPPQEDGDAIIDRLQKYRRELKQGPIGKNLSSVEKRNFLINTLLHLEDSKEVVYGTLDAWVAFEQDFPLASIKQALLALEKEQQWHRIVQVIKWMLSKGQGTTLKTYEQLVFALEKDNRAEEAHRIWEKVAHDLHSIPWSFCDLMLGVYYRNNMLDRLVKLFKELEAHGRKPRSKSIVRKVEDAYEMLGLLEEKYELLDKYKDLYKPLKDDRKKGWKSKKAEKGEKAADSSKQNETGRVQFHPSNMEPDDGTS